MKKLLVLIMILIGSLSLISQLDTVNTIGGYRAAENPAGSFAFINNTIVGVKGGFNLGAGDHNTYIGHHTGYRDSVSPTSTADYDGNSFVGSFAGEYNQGSRSAFLGHNAGRYSIGSFNSFFGNSSGRSNNGFNNSFYGSYSGSGNVGNYNSYYGFKSGYYLNNSDPTGEYNSYFGYKAGEDQIGSRNAFFGAYISNNNNSGTGNDNSYFGYNAGSKYNGFSNAFFGANSGKDNEGDTNAYFGASSGVSCLGSSNTFIGYAAGSNVVKGTNNVIIGYKAGPESSDPDHDSKLFIHNSTTGMPLIYGDFNRNEIVINGTFEATGGVSNNSSIHVKNNFEEISIDQILEKVSELDIKKWTYKDSEIPHIGPVAQDFYNKFLLGGDETKISTIDADGIALAAIQALKNENDKLRDENVELKKKLDEVDKRLTYLELSRN